MCRRAQVNKVAGNFHFAAGHSYQQGSMHIHDMAPFAEKTLDFTHKIHSLSFGQPYPVSNTSTAAQTRAELQQRLHMHMHVAAACIDACIARRAAAAAAPGLLQGMRNPLDGVMQLSPHQKPTQMTKPDSGSLKKTAVSGMFQ